MSRWSISLLLLLSLSWCGCTAMTSMGRGMKSVLKGDPGPTAGDRGDDAWTNEAGSLTHDLHPREEINDPLGLRDIFVSEKAQDIERNLGVGP